MTPAVAFWVGLLLGVFILQSAVVVWLLRQDRTPIEYLVGPPGPPGPMGLAGECKHKEDQ